MVETLITFAAGVFIGSSLGVFLMALAVAAKREDEELEELGAERPVNKHWEKLQSEEDASPKRDSYLPLCEDCKHYVRHDRRCGYWKRGVDPLNGCNFGERRDDEIDGSIPY